ncbi:MAG: PAS domain S-box protein [Methanospirillum sp.]|uniref:PAS domain S-box protein n=1 Tax=Methanospirillum sp. TaxID=45200 RepID=UPI00237453DA|nr:PAS domain S-box protein [Methanospirillum sp.]MDD1728624.1 PAS domain S-box protein [Methanospirillum sp.]
MIPPEPDTHNNILASENNDLISLLYVDDEEDLLTLGKIFLERTGEFKVETQTSATVALRSRIIQSYDAIISDYQMPGMDGIEFLKTVREQYGDIPFILFTGRGREEVVIEAINNGADFYIQKGGDPKPQFAELSHKVKQAVRRKQAEDERLTQFNELIQTKKALQESESKFRAIIETSPDVIWELTLEGIFTYVSPRSSDIFGFHPEELIGTSVFSFFTPEGKDIVQVLLADTTHRKPGLTTFDIPAIIKDGSVRIFNCRSYPLMSTDGMMIGFRGVTSDVTEKIQYIKALHESEVRLRSFIESTSEAVSLIDEDGKVIEWNASSEKLTGIRKEEALGSYLWDITYRMLPLKYQNDASRMKIKQKVLSSLKTGIPFFKKPHLFESIHQDGTRIFTKRIVFPIKTEKGYRFGSLAQDVSDERRMAEALQESEKRFRGMAERSSDLILILDKDMKPTYVSPSSRWIIGYEPEELIGKSPEFALTTLFSQAGSYLSNAIYKTLHGEIAENVEIQVTKKDGTLIFVNLHAIPIILHGLVTGVQVSMRDITQNKIIELALRDSEEKFGTVFRLNPVPLTLVSLIENVFTDVNDAFLAGTGYTRDEVIGQHPDTLGIFADITEYNRLASELRKKHIVRGMEVKSRLKTGEIRFVKFSSSRIYIQGKPQILSIVEDINEQKAAESAVNAIVSGIVGTTGKESLDRISESITKWLSADCVMIGEITPDKEHVHVLSMILDDKKVLDYSYQLKGTPSDEVIKKGFVFYPANSGVHFPDCKPLAGLQIQGYIGVPLKNSYGEIVGILSILSQNPFIDKIRVREVIDIIAVKAGADIERAHIEETLLTKEQILADTMEMANLVGWEWNVLSQNFIFNDRFYTLYGTTVEHEGGYFMSPERYVREFVFPADIPKVREEVTTSFNPANAHQIFRFEHRIIRRDGAVRYISVFFRVTFDDEGRVVNSIGASQDITEEKLIEEAIRKTNRQLHLLNDITRHDILNKISGFSGYLAILEMESKDPVILDYIHKMNEGIKDIQSEIEFSRVYQKIEFSRVYQNLGSHEPQWISLDIILSRLPLPKTISFSSTCTGLSVFADPMLESVFKNLLDNSIRHGQHVTNITVSVHTENNHLTIIWEDNGVGVLVDNKERIFEREFGKHTGYGLFLVREILSLTGISIKETGVFEEGARFEIIVPSGSFMGSE